MHELTRKALTGCGVFIVLCAILVFLPAGTLDFWQAWILLPVFALSIVWITVYFLKRDPKLIERRLKAGPGPEKDPRQKRIQALASASMSYCCSWPASIAASAGPAFRRSW